MPEPRTGTLDLDPRDLDAVDPATVPVDDDAPYRPQPISFVRRSGRLNPRQARGWEAHRGDFLVDVPRGRAATSVDPGFVLDVAATFGRSAPLVVEVGSGQGDAALAAAESDPGRDVLAVEVYTPGLARTVRLAAQRGLTNLRLIQANAVEVLSSTIPAGRADEVWVFFPDPWHKSRHRKRRLVTPAFAALAARVLRPPADGCPGGVLRLATDWDDYAKQMIDVLDAAPALVNLYGPGAVAPRFDGRAVTGFEKKALAAGRTVVDLAYRRTAGTPTACGPSPAG